MPWLGEYCPCGNALPPATEFVRHRVNGVEICGDCWKKPRIAPSVLNKENMKYGKASTVSTA